MSHVKLVATLSAPRFSLLRLISPVFFALAPGFASAQDSALCQPTASGSKHQTSTAPKRLVPDDHVVVESRKVERLQNERTEFVGDVTIFQEQQTVKADRAIYDEQKSQFTAKGNVELDSKSARVTGQSIFIDEINKDFSLLDAQYQFGFNSGRGQAREFSIDNNQKLKLDGATFTTCPGDDPSWLFSSDNIFIDQEKGWGEAWNTVFKIADVPVVYIPYLTFPITDKRKSGLLFPELGSSSRFGAYYAQPIYFNFDTNLDATLTPKYMSERGLLWQSNVRYLSENSYNTLQLEYLNEDKEYKDLNARYLGYWQHESNWSDNWNVQWQMTKLSDDNYISDFNSDFHHQADTHLNNFLVINYLSEKFDVSLLSQNMQELGPHTPSYKVPLQIQSDWRIKDYGNGVLLNLNSQYSYFSHGEFEVENVNRLHLEPKLEFQYYSPAFQFESAASYLSTFYNKKYRTETPSEDIQRNVFKFRMLSGLNFEKQTNYFELPVRQTFEPKVLYLYVEESDQTDIGLYDSQLLKEDYFALFRDNTYSSIDRIEALNQATIGFSSSIFDNKNKELLRLGIGQVHKFDNRSEIKGTNGGSQSSKPALAVEFFGRLSTNWQMDGGFLYNRDTEEVDTGFVSLDYYLAKDKNVQVNHRYARDVAGIKINQTGLFASYTFNPKWSIASSYHYDSVRDVHLDGMLGLEYRACCWSMQLSVQRQVRLDLNSTEQLDTTDVEYDNSVGIKFRINGLGGELASSVSKMFSDSIFAYRRPYLITK